MARNAAHDPGPFFTAADEDIRGEYGNQRDDHGRFFCGLMSAIGITFGAVVLGIMVWSALGTTELRNQEAFSGYRTASTEQVR